MNWFKQLISEHGNQSMTRFLSLMCTSTACIIALVALYNKVDLNSVVGICSTFLGFGLGAKVFQKNIEAKDISDEGTK